MRPHVLLAFLALAACQPLPLPIPPGPDADAAPTPLPPPEPTPEPGNDPCAVAFNHLLGIDCVPPKPASGSWADVCRNARANGVFGLKCIRELTNRADAARCGVTCE